jgi:hypothetical protein
MLVIQLSLLSALGVVKGDKEGAEFIIKKSPCIACSFLRSIYLSS